MVWLSALLELNRNIGFESALYNFQTAMATADAEEICIHFYASKYIFDRICVQNISDHKN